MTQTSRKKRILYIVHHRPDRSPGQRYRCEQYIPYLQEHGYEVHYSNLLDERDDKLFYSKGNYLGKAGILAKSLRLRLRDLLRIRRYDIIFIYREAMMIGSTFFERRFARSKAKVIFDFDDAIWLPAVSEGNKALSFLKKPEKTGALIRLADLVFAGNEYLAGYARQYQQHVAVVPSTIDLSMYNRLKEPKQAGPVCIGWTGSFSTIEHFEHAIPALKRIKEKYGDQVCFKVIGDPSYRCAELGITGEPWQAETEVDDLLKMDIGIMPLPDNEWTRGKCAMKGLQYMALGIPTVMSPVGMNKDVIEHGRNGYLATGMDEWVKCLSELINNLELRYNTGLAGRQTVETAYSTDIWKQAYLGYFNQLANSTNHNLA